MVSENQGRVSIHPLTLNLLQTNKLAIKQFHGSQDSIKTKKKDKKTKNHLSAHLSLGKKLDISRTKSG
uniref:Uncharacterized protein n=1 Tax=Solanum tuberosum TaxID=4113 RepID=M1B2A4_SOLTU